MYRFGRIAGYLGLVLTVLGIVVGFGALFNHAEELAKVFLAIIPVGFVILFAGVTTTLLSGPKKGDQ